MRFTISSTALSSRLLSLSRVINSKNTLPILNCFVFEVQNGQLTITASDSENVVCMSMNLDSLEGEGKFAVVESKVKDESINKLLEDADSLADNPGTLTGIQLVPLTDTNFVNTSKNTKIINLDDFISSILPAKSVVARNMNTRIYLSLSEYSRDSLSYIFGIVIFSGMGLMTLIAAFIIRKKTVDSFKELYRLYPELEGNLELLDTQAEFYDQDLKVILYKNHLITYYKGTEALDLRDVWRIYLVRTSYSRFTKVYQFVYTRKDSSKKYSLTIRNTNRVEEQLEEFWNLLPRKFPEINIGSL